MTINVRISFIVVFVLRLVIISSFFIISPAKVGIIMDIAKQSTTKIIFAVRGNLLTALLLSKVSFHLKPERLHFDVTGGEALGQDIASSSPAPAWKAVPQRLMVLPSRQQGASCALIPRASPPVTKSKALQAF